MLPPVVKRRCSMQGRRRHSISLGDLRQPDNDLLSPAAKSSVICPTSKGALTSKGSNVVNSSSFGRLSSFRFGSNSPAGGSPRRSDPTKTLEAAVPLLARKHQMDMLEVTPICRAVQSAIFSDSGRLTFDDFKKMICAVLDVHPDQADDKDWEFHYKASGDGKADIDALLTWYKCNMFALTSTLQAKSGNRKSDQMLYALAKEHDVSVVVLDKVKKQFDFFDKDGSGGIDKLEFHDMIHILMGAKDESQVSKQRIQTFWNMASTKKNNVVDFHEFCAFYVDNFMTGNQQVDGMSSTDMTTAFYNVQRRGGTIQRRRSLTG